VIGLRDLMDEAKRLGVSVHLVHIDDEWRIGEYSEASQEIVVDLALTMPEMKWTLAHELAHAYYRHTCSSPANERQADRRAARLLVDLTDYVMAESIDPHPEFIADELGVPRRAVRVFQREWLPALSLRRRA
jgi:Zn-dependent peptidase ImmA (M78 family)